VQVFFLMSSQLFPMWLNFSHAILAVDLREKKMNVFSNIEVLGERILFMCLARTIAFLLFFANSHNPCLLPIC